MEIDGFDIADFCERAVTIGRDIAGVELDYSVGSLEGLETVLQSIRSVNRNGLLNDTVCWNASVCLGTYLGEVMLRDQLGSKGFSWQPDSNGLPMLMDSEKKNAVSPISKIYKKLIPDNDSEGTVSGLYRAFLLLLANNRST